MDDEEVEIGAVPEAAADPIALPTNAEDEEGGVPMWLVVLMRRWRCSWPARSRS